MVNIKSRYEQKHEWMEKGTRRNANKHLGTWYVHKVRMVFYIYFMFLYKIHTRKEEDQAQARLLHTKKQKKVHKSRHPTPLCLSWVCWICTRPDQKRTRQDHKKGKKKGRDSEQVEQWKSDFFFLPALKLLTLRAMRRKILSESPRWEEKRVPVFYFSLFHTLFSRRDDDDDRTRWTWSERKCYAFFAILHGELATR